MKRKYFYLLLTFLSVLHPGFTQRTVTYNNETTICVDEVSDLGHLNFFTWSAKQILDALAGSEFLKEKEWKTVELNPRLVLYIKEAADLGLEISESFCPLDPNSTSNGTYGVNDEVDSIRHFVMSSYLSWKAGPDAARKFMAAHEDSLFANDNMMDYYNNDLGFQFGEAQRRKYANRSMMENNLPEFLSDLRSEIQRKHNLPRGNSQDFLILTSGPSTCAKRKYPNF